MIRLRASRFGATSRRPSPFAAAVCAALTLLLPLVACGKKGAPLEPLRPLPGQPTEPAARRLGPTVRIQFTLPIENISGPPPVSLDRVEIYALTLAPGAVAPLAKEFLVKENIVATIAVRPPPVQEEPTDESEEKKKTAPPAAPEVKDDRPGPGERVSVVEQLTEVQLTPTILPKPLVTRKDQEIALAAAGPPPPPDPAVPTRVYIARGVSRHGKYGAPSSRMSVPLVSAPPAVTDLETTLTEKALSIGWTPPPQTVDPAFETFASEAAAVVAAWLPKAAAFAEQAPVERPRGKPATILRPDVTPFRLLPGAPLPLSAPVPPRFNIYEIVDGKVAELPLNPLPIVAARFPLGEPEWDKERCFVVRTVRRYGIISIENEGAGPLCVTPRDTFPPAPPTGLRVVAMPGAMSLIWNANSEPDLAGYLVLRGEAPGATLQPLTAAPIKDTTFKDANVKPGVRYVYAIVAVDAATTPNTSKESARQEEVAR